MKNSVSIFLACFIFYAYVKSVALFFCFYLLSYCLNVNCSSGILLSAIILNHFEHCHSNIIQYNTFIYI